MKVLGNILGVVVALALTAVVGIGGYFAARRFVTLFARLDFQVAMMTAIAAIVVLLAAMIIASSIRRVGTQNREVRLRAGKAEAYNMFLRLWEEMLRPGQTVEATAQLAREIQEVNHLLVLHSCAAVVKAHAAMRTQALSPAETRIQLASVLLAIRKDLGLESRGLEGKALVQLLMGEADNAPSGSRSGMCQDAQPRVSLVPN